MGAVYGSGRFTGLDPLGEAMGGALAGFFQRKTEQKDWGRVIDLYKAAMQLQQGQQNPPIQTNQMESPTSMPGANLGGMTTNTFGVFQPPFNPMEAMGMAQGRPFSNLPPQGNEGGMMLGGQANSPGGQMLGGLGGPNPLAGVNPQVFGSPQQEPEMPQINFDALRKISDPDMRDMVNKWLMGMAIQREEMRQKQDNTTINTLRNQGYNDSQIRQILDTKYGLSPRAQGPRQTTQTEQLTDSIDSAYDSVFDMIPGTMTTSTDLDKRPIPDVNYEPSNEDMGLVNETINDWATTYSELTGIAPQTLKRVALSRLKTRYPKIGKTGQATISPTAKTGVQLDDETQLRMKFIDIGSRVAPALHKKMQEALNAGVTLEEILASPDLEPYTTQKP